MSSVYKNGALTIIPSPGYGSISTGAFPGYDMDTRASPESPGNLDEKGEPAFEPNTDTDTDMDTDTGESPGAIKADPKTGSGMDGENPKAADLISGPEEAMEPQVIEGFEAEVLAQLEVTNMFLFHQEILLVFLVGGLIFALVYRIIKHNITNHFT